MQEWAQWINCISITFRSCEGSIWLPFTLACCLAWKTVPTVFPIPCGDTFATEKETIASSIIWFLVLYLSPSPLSSWELVPSWTWTLICKLLFMFLNPQMHKFNLCTFLPSSRGDLMQFFPYKLSAFTFFFQVHAFIDSGLMFQRGWHWRTAGGWGRRRPSRSRVRSHLFIQTPRVL